MVHITSFEQTYEGKEADLIQYAIAGLSFALQRRVLALITVTSDGQPELAAPPDHTEALLQFFELSSEDVIKALRDQVDQDNAAKN